MTIAWPKLKKRAGLCENFTQWRNDIRKCSRIASKTCPLLWTEVSKPGRVIDGRETVGAHGYSWNVRLDGRLPGTNVHDGFEKPAFPVGSWLEPSPGGGPDAPNGYTCLHVMIDWSTRRSHAGQHPDTAGEHLIRTLQDAYNHQSQIAPANPQTPISMAVQSIRSLEVRWRIFCEVSEARRSKGSSLHVTWRGRVGVESMVEREQELLDSSKMRRGGISCPSVQLT